MTKVVNGNWDGVTQLITNHLSIFGQVFNTFLSNLRSCERMHQVGISGNGWILNQSAFDATQ